MEERLAATAGQRIRLLREQSGKSLREQARELGIAPSSLSAVENSRGGISLRRLQQVADGFGVHIADLLAEPVDGGPPVGPYEVFRGSARPPGIERGKGTLYQMLGRPEGHTLQPCLISFQPGASYEGDAIAHPGEEFVFVLLGEVELLHDDECLRLTTGDGVRFRSDIAHAFRNASDTAFAVLLGVGTPPW
jgi:transcriptional regulator with XRE-family HTH domain